MAIEHSIGTDVQSDIWLIGIGILAIVIGVYLSAPVHGTTPTDHALFTGLAITMHGGGWGALLTWYITQ